MNNFLLAQNEIADPHSEDSRLKVTSMIMTLFQKWEISTSAQLKLLGMKSSSRAVLSNYRRGDRAIPDDEDKLRRAGLLLLIHKCLRLLFPHNPRLIYSWMKRKNKAFEDKTPLDVISQHGLFGLARVAHYLEFQLVT